MRIERKSITSAMMAALRISETEACSAYVTVREQAGTARGLTYFVYDAPNLGPGEAPLCKVTHASQL